MEVLQHNINYQVQSLSLFYTFNPLLLPSYFSKIFVGFFFKGSFYLLWSC